jgi:hypothetical protein
MQEELNNFTRNEVWSLVERPKQNVIGNKMSMVLLQETKHSWLPKVSLKWRDLTLVKHMRSKVRINKNIIYLCY